MAQGKERSGSRIREITSLATQLIRLQEEQEPENSERWGFNDGGAGNEHFKIQQAAIWVATSVDFSKDHATFQQYSKQHQNLLLRCLVIFQTLDGAVIDSVATKMFLLAPNLSMKLPYTIQIYMEAVHSQSYDLQLRALVKDDRERTRLLKEADGHEWITRYINYDKKHILESNDDEIYMLTAQASLEGIGFIALFSIIFYFKYHPELKDIEGITASNTYIARDESAHRDYAVYRIKELLKTYSAEEISIVMQRIQALVIELVEVVESAIPTLLPEDLADLTQQQLIDNTRYTADLLLEDIGLPRYYNAPLALEYMRNLSTSRKTNMYERETTEYSHNNIHDPTDADDF